jgi:hypothetical protein
MAMNYIRGKLGWETSVNRLAREQREREEKAAQEEKARNEWRKIQRQNVAREKRGFPSYLAKQPLEILRERSARNAATLGKSRAEARESQRQAAAFFGAADGGAAAGGAGAAAAAMGYQNNGLAQVEARLPPTPPMAPLVPRAPPAPLENRPQVAIPNIVIEHPAAAGGGGAAYRPPSAVGFRSMPRAGSPTSSVMAPVPLTASVPTGTFAVRTTQGGKRKRAQTKRRKASKKTRKVRGRGRRGQRSRRN